MAGHALFRAGLVQAEVHQDPAHALALELQRRALVHVQDGILECRGDRRLGAGEIPGVDLLHDRRGRHQALANVDHSGAGGLGGVRPGDLRAGHGQSGHNPAQDHGGTPFWTRSAAYCCGPANWIPRVSHLSPLLPRTL